MMGFSYSLDNGPIMCFNGAKSWQLGWYSSKHVELLNFNTPGQSWSGQLVGIADYGNNLSENVLIKLEAGNILDYFINFNRQTGINSGTREAGNQVLITSRGGTNGYSESTLLAKLSTGGSYIIENFAGSGLPVIIQVTAINTGVSPAHADITISSATPAPTPAPTPFFCTADAQCKSLGDNDFFACPAWTSCDINTNTCVEGCDCNGSCDAGETENTCASDCAAETSLFTTDANNNGSQGNMWTLMSKKDVVILRVDAHLTTTGTTTAKVFTKLGEYAGSETNAADWTLIQTATVTGQGGGTLTSLPLLDNPIVVPAGTTQSFYVQSDGGIQYTNGSSEGSVYASDENIDFLEGIGKSGEFGSTFRPRIWNGRVVYVVVPDGTPPPIESPSDSPSGEPSIEPSQDPSGQPSMTPSDAPSNELSQDPSAEPSLTPSDEPSLSSAPSVKPSSEPSLEPSSVPSMLPSSEPSSVPSKEPSNEPSLSSAPSEERSNEPSESAAPSEVPSNTPSTQPSGEPSNEPSLVPSSIPSSEPSSMPSVTPPSSKPSFVPSEEPSTQPSESQVPSANPSSEPSSSSMPSEEPSSTPSAPPTLPPTPAPTRNPTRAPTRNPTPLPTTFDCRNFDNTSKSVCEGQGCNWSGKNSQCTVTKQMGMRRRRK